MIKNIQENLFDRFNNKSVSILASGPSLELFLDNEEKSRNDGPIIGVNGASRLIRKNDIFISGEEGTHKEKWFYSCPADAINIVRACSALYTKRFYPDNNERKGLINRFQNFLNENQKYIKTRWDGIREIIPEELQNPFDLTLPNPVLPHILLHQVINMTPDTKINKQQKYLIIGGTVTCLATQIAYHLGAKEIHLYGAQFTNEKSMEEGPGQNYSKLVTTSGGGYTTPYQRETFDEVIAQIRKEVKVFSHGYSGLKNTIKIDR